MPISLSKIKSLVEIRKLGDSYRELVQSEARRKTLINILSEKNNGQNINKFSNRLIIEDFLKQKIKEDFSTDNIIIVNGWVLSKTEAQQCALFSII